MTEKLLINAFNFNQEANTDQDINSPTTLKAIKLLGYEQEDLKKINKEQIELETKKKLEDIPLNRLDEFVEVKMQHYEIRRLHRIEQVRELRQKLLRENEKKDQNISQMNSTFQSYSFSREEYLEKEKKKLEKLQEKQRKQIDFLIKNQIQIEEIRRRNEHKKEKIRLLGEKRIEEQRKRQLINEEQKSLREQKNIEMEQQRQEEQKRLQQKFQEKQSQLQLKMLGKQKEFETKKQKNQEVREKLEQKIVQIREGQQASIQQILQNYQRKEVVNENKKKLFQEQLHQKFQKRRAASESKSQQITQQKFMKMQQEEEKKQEQQQIFHEKERSIQEMYMREENQRKENARLRQDKINKVKEQFQKSLIDLQQKNQVQEQTIYQLMERAQQNRTERYYDKQLKCYDHQIRIEETLNNAKRVEKQHEIQRFKILQKISDDNEKLLKIQNEKREMAKVKAKIQADHEKEKQQIIKEMNTIQRYNESIKLDKSVYSSQNNESFMMSTFHDTKKQNLFQNQISTPTSFFNKKQNPKDDNLSSNNDQQSKQDQIIGQPNNINILAFGKKDQFNRVNSSQVDIRKKKSQQPSSNFQDSQQNQQTEPSQQTTAKQLIQKPRYKQNSDFNAYNLTQTPSIQQANMTTFQAKVEQEKRIKMISFLREHEDVLKMINRSKSVSYNPHLQQYNQSSVIRQRQLEYSQSARYTNNMFNIQYQDKKPQKLDYKSNKLVKNIISQDYVIDIHTHQKIICQELNIILQKELIALHSTQQINDESNQLMDLEESKLEKISKEILRSYQKQEQKSSKIHQIYKFFECK
ncbi:hypothetical protein TTHERM_00106810 (macronuclear) [Tetrahymena thermophila SB210]|uniref:Uncharacterized protein n=1 Tax=Tetrahymena thermophila (strain SB210) TaxID=312017 RepID=Q234C3_TETTS|nr:hypothetical protein TTHERM_00106810 [Tetrahymena thermophila SB210]EAR92080.2 hypothetical protein TTHERM_00106810 [Tetrahymena thermophila SB210]|eukprot:XP_001012325.2 hypothetical protein TTHERM_00106810 [Tetrahymena thermophila SB210]